MKNTVFIISIALIFGVFGKRTMSQINNDAVLIKIADESITKSEFINVYQKNNIKNEVMDQASLLEYLDLYVNFRLKVKEAEDLKLDTAKSFRNELMGYRKQLAQPYLTDKEVTEKLIKEAYDRMLYDVRASHILIKVSQNANPKDTLAAYKKIMDLRARIIKGESFEKLAKEFSDDPSAKDQADADAKHAAKGNGGDLGYFTAFSMLYPFENAAYSLKVGEISMPVRTQYGYHLVKLTDKRKTLGTFQVAHIMVVPNSNSPEDTIKAKTKIFEIYEKLKKGENFEELAKQFSDDKGSGSKGGVLPSLTSNRVVPEFSIAVAKIQKIGDISEPVKTTFGWHIIKLIDKKDIGTFDELKGEIKNKVSKDSRSAKGKDAIINKVKATYNYKEYPIAINEFSKVVDSTIFYGKWNVEAAKNLNKPIFSLAGVDINQQEFAKYLAKQQSNRTKEDITGYINAMFKKFVDEYCINYEDANLEKTNPEFNALIKEYKDGIMLFELTDQKVWSKAVKDSSGLESFYQKNKNNYMWGERLDATIYTCADKNIATKTRKILKSAAKKGLNDNDILKQINTDSQLNLTIESKKFSKTDNNIIDSIPWVKGITKDIVSGKSIVFVDVKNVLAPEPKLLSEIRGIVTADYQTFLEKEWIENLKQKYTVVVNQEVFKSLYSK